MNILPTNRLDLQNTYLYEIESIVAQENDQCNEKPSLDKIGQDSNVPSYDQVTVIDYRTDPKLGLAMILNQSIFHPQGGGQPCDTGIIKYITKGSLNSGSKGEAIEFGVEMVKDIDGFIHHFGSFKSTSLDNLENIKETSLGNENFSIENGEENSYINLEKRVPIGSTVNLYIDVPRRKLNAKLHSGGHILDLAVAQCGYPLKGTKGFHFPEGPYVEYKLLSSDRNIETNEMVLELNEKISKIIEDKVESKVEYYTKTELENAQGGEGNQCDDCCSSSTTNEFIPNVASEDVAHFSDEQKIRFVSWGIAICPCGGTHLQNSEELKNMTITKIKAKKGNYRISYKISDE